MLSAKDVASPFCTLIPDPPFAIWLCIFDIMKSFPFNDTGGIDILTSFIIGMVLCVDSLSFGFEGVDKLDDADVVDVEVEETELNAYDVSSCCFELITAGFELLIFEVICCSSSLRQLFGILFLSVDFDLDLGELNLENDFIFLI